MGVKELIAVPNDVEIIATAKATHNTATTAAFDFGTPNDVNLEALASAGKYRPGDRILVAFAATTAGNTDTVSFSVQDAPDNAGSIGTPGAAETAGALTGGTGDQYALASVRLRAGRPWLRANVTSDGATDAFAVTCTVMRVRRAGV